MSCREWREVKLGDLCDIVMGQSPKGENCNNAGNGTPLLNGPTEFGLFYPQAIQYTTDVKKQCRVGDLLFCVRGSTTGRMNWANEKYAIGRGLAAIRHKNGFDYNPFIRGLLDYKLDEILKSATGSTFPNVSKDLLNLLQVNVPPLDDQKAIADTLSCLDDKIELNNRINKTLEEMAQAIFKSWFVDFEPFQDVEFEDSELGQIPKGWGLSELGELVEIVNGYSYKGAELKESNDALMTIKNFNRNGGFKVDGFKEIVVTKRVKDRHYLNHFDVVMACTDLTQNADIIGNPLMILTKCGFRKLIASMDLIKVVPIKEVSPFFLFSALRDVRFKNFAVSCTSGTTVLHLDKKAILKYKVVIPEEKLILTEYTNLIEPVLRFLAKNLEENRAITIIRDTLLPKLMSGEIRVPVMEV